MDATRPKPVVDAAAKGDRTFCVSSVVPFTVLRGTLKGVIVVFLKAGVGTPLRPVIVGLKTVVGGSLNKQLRRILSNPGVVVTRSRVVVDGVATGGGSVGGSSLFQS